MIAADERLALLVDAECLARDNKRLATALRDAKLRLSQACVEDIDYAPRRELDRALLRQLATGRWIAEHHTVLITGATGIGKTYLACALAQQACRHGYRALYRRVPRLREELTLAHADGSYLWLLARFARANVLVLDDWGLGVLRDQDRRNLLESSKIAPAPAPPSSPASCPRPNGTSTWRTRRSPTPSAIASSTRPIDSC